MRNNLWMKGLVLGTIIFLIGADVIQVLGANINNNNEIRDAGMAFENNPTVEKIDDSEVDKQIKQKSGYLYDYSDYITTITIPDPVIPDGTPKNRYISFIPGNSNGLSQAFYLSIYSCPLFPDRVGFHKWVVPYGDGTAILNSSNPYFWNSDETIDVGDIDIVPQATYRIESTTDGIHFSDPVLISTVAKPNLKIWGDIVGPKSGNIWAPPDGKIDLLDLKAVLQAWLHKAEAPPLSWVDIAGDSPDRIINLKDVVHEFFAVLGFEFPFSGPISEGPCYNGTIEEIDSHDILYSPYQFLPKEKIETGLLVDVGSALHRHLINNATGMYPENETAILSSVEFMEAYGDIQKSWVDNEKKLPEYQTLKEISQYYAEQRINAISLAFIDYNSLDEHAIDNGLLQIVDANGTVIPPPSEPPQEEIDYGLNFIVETEAGHNQSYLNTHVFCAGGFLRDELYVDYDNYLNFIIPSDLVITNGRRGGNLSISIIPGEALPPVDAVYANVTLDRVYCWDLSEFPSYNGTIDFTCIIRSDYEKYNWSLFMNTNQNVSPYLDNPNNFCYDEAFVAEYPRSQPSWWPLSGYPGDDWESKPDDPLLFFTNNPADRPEFWPDYPESSPYYIPWPCKWNWYRDPTSGFWSYYMGRRVVIVDKVIRGHKYNYADGYWNINDETAETEQNFSSAFIYRYYFADHRRNDDDRCLAENLVILVDGFDVDNSRTIPTMLVDFGYVIEKMIFKGYDVLILDYMGINGNTHIQRNGYALIDVFKRIPDFMTERCTSHDAIIVTGSMGSQTTRYGLCKMEELGMNHHVGLWIVIDGPFLGANIPMSLQVFVRFCRTVSESAQNMLSGLESPASCEMLIHNSKAPSYLGPYFMQPRYYQECNDLNGGKGVPLKCRKVTIASGSGQGFSSNGHQFGQNPAGGYDDFHYAYLETIKLKNLYYGVDIDARTESENLFYGKIKIPLMYHFKNGKQIPYGTKIFSKCVWTITEGDQDIDFCPGGYRTSAKVAVDFYNGAAEDDVAGMTYDYPMHNFMSTYTALYDKNIGYTPIKETIDIYKKTYGLLPGVPAEDVHFSVTTTVNEPDYWYGPEDPNDYPYSMDPSIETDSPFDAIWYEEKNTEHVITKGSPPVPGDEMVIFHEMDRFTSQEEYTQRLNTDIPDTKIASHEIYLFGNLIGDIAEEVLTLNTITKKAMVQNSSYIEPTFYVRKLYNNSEDSSHPDNYIGNWYINKGDKFFLINLSSVSGNYCCLLCIGNKNCSSGAWAMIQKLVKDPQGGAYKYKWEEIWNNNGNGYLGPWEIQSTDMYIIGDFLSNNPGDELLIIYPYLGSWERESVIPGSGGRSRASILTFNENLWGETWNNDNSLQWIKHGRPIRYGDHYEFGKLKNTGCDSLFSGILYRSLFGSGNNWSYTLQDFIPNQYLWSNFWSNIQLSNWQDTIEDAFYFADINNDSYDELICTQPNQVLILKYNTQTNNWNILYTGAPGHPEFFGQYPMQKGDRFYVGNLINAFPGDEVLAVNPKYPENYKLQSYDISEPSGWIELFHGLKEDYFGFWLMFETL